MPFKNNNIEESHQKERKTLSILVTLIYEKRFKFRAYYTKMKDMNQVRYFISSFIVTNINQVRLAICSLYVSISKYKIPKSVWKNNDLVASICIRRNDLYNEIRKNCNICIYIYGHGQPNSVTMSHQKAKELNRIRYYSPS